MKKIIFRSVLIMITLTVLLSMIYVVVANTVVVRNAKVYLQKKYDTEFEFVKIAHYPSLSDGLYRLLFCEKNNAELIFQVESYGSGDDMKDLTNDCHEIAGHDNYLFTLFSEKAVEDIYNRYPNAKYVEHIAIISTHSEFLVPEELSEYSTLYEMKKYFEYSIYVYADILKRANYQKCLELADELRAGEEECGLQEVYIAERSLRRKR